MSGRVPAGWTRVPPAGTCSRQVGTCSTMWAHRPRKPHILRLSSALPAILESRGEDLTTAAQDLAGGHGNEGMVRFAVPESPDRGTSAHLPGLCPGRWAPRRQADTVPGVRRHGRRSTPTHPGSSPACWRPAASEHDQTCRDPVERVRADLTVPRSDAGDRPVHAPRPSRRRSWPPEAGEGVARRAAVETDQLRSPARWLAGVSWLARFQRSSPRSSRRLAYDLKVRVARIVKYLPATRRPNCTVVTWDDFEARLGQLRSYAFGPLKPALTR